jgi:hypothetical protein
MQIEHQHAVALIQWWSLFARTKGIDERLLFSIPNAGGYVGGFKKNMLRVMSMKREGVRPGVPDYFLAIPKAGAGGLFIELKAPNGDTSKDQKEVLALLESQSYGCTVAYGWDKAKTAIEEWLKP